MKFNEFKENKKQPDLIQVFRDFLPVVMSELKLKTLPKIRLEKHLEHDDQPSFGRFMHSKDYAEIHLAIKDRHPLDIIRTLAHELVHFKQYTENKLNKNSGTTGSPDENEAHVKTGIIMRHFNKKFPEHFNNSSISLDENFKDGRNPQDKGDSKRHNVPTKASVSTLRKVAKGGGRRGQLAHWMANMKSGRKKAKEEYVTGDKAQVKGKGPMPKAKLGRTDHPFHGKLVGGT
jgi:hypothetical protein